MNRALKTTIKSMGLLIGLSVMACGLSSCGMLNQQAAQSDVHVMLNDGQVIVGELTTPIFTLKTELGTLKFDTDEAGELGPLEGNDMKQSDKLVRLWLKNGSEFVGGWQKASVEMSLRIGDKDISIDVPIDKLKRLRFKGDPVWSDKPLYRVVTRSGDDFFVEADSSQIHFTSELGSFSPYLAEISSLVQLDGEENKWQVQLKNGSRLNAEIKNSGLVFTGKAIEDAMGSSINIGFTILLCIIYQHTGTYFIANNADNRSFQLLKISPGRAVNINITGIGPAKIIIVQGFILKNRKVGKPDCPNL